MITMILMVTIILLIIINHNLPFEQDKVLLTTIKDVIPTEHRILMLWQPSVILYSNVIFVL